MNIGEVVRRIRKARGLSTAELGNRMGITSKMVEHLERGFREWYVRHVISAARALGIRPFLLVMSDRDRRRALRIFR